MAFVQLTTMRTTCGQNCSSIGRNLPELLPLNSPKWGQVGPETKKKTLLFLLGKVKNNKYPEAEAWNPESIDEWCYYWCYEWCYY